MEETEKQDVIRIRKMVKEDCEEIAKLEQRSFSCPWSQQAFLETIDKKDVFYLIAEKMEKSGGKKRIGYIGVWQSFEEGDIVKIAVAPEERKKGIASLLLQEAVSAALLRGMTALTLEVRASNQAAIHLYEKAGFLSEGIRPGYYEKPKEDAIIMWNRSLRGITIEKQKNYPV